jgi:hypothetical protein
MATRKRATPTRNPDAPLYDGGISLGFVIAEAGIAPEDAARIMGIPAGHFALMLEGAMPLPHPAVTNYLALIESMFTVDFNIETMLEWHDADRRAWQKSSGTRHKPESDR